MEKNETKVRAGLIGSQKRWGPRRHVRLTDLPPDVAHTIRLILDAEESRAKREAEQARATG